MQSGNGKADNGVWYAVAAYGFWGLFPIYWKLLRHVPATQLMSHRVLWSFLWLVAVLAYKRGTNGLWKAAMPRGVWPIYLGAALLLSCNWLLYVWAVNAGFIVETSLGYFINPLLSVLIGVIFLRERLRMLQWLPIVVAAAGVLYLTCAHGAPPWIALALASTFATYGLLKKLAPLESLQGLTLETAMLFLPVLAYLGYCEATGRGSFLHGGICTDILIVGAGIVTTVPLLLFAVAARRIPLTLVGILQYIAPTLQFLIGVLVYREPFGTSQLLGFGAVWLALVIFGIENILWRRTQAAPALPE